MMFLVIFSSLAAAMAVVAQGNLRTADSGLKLSRAMSAAESGMVFAARRLGIESSRFVVEKGVISADYAEDLWMGSYDEAADGDVTVLPPTGYTTTTPPSGIVHAIRDAHLADAHSFIAETGDSSLPDIDGTYGTLRVRPIRLANEAGSAYFRLTYELLDSVPYVRVTSTGVDGDITRTLQMDFRIEKKIEFAVLSPNRIMIGKNVLIEGPLGSRFGLVAGELDSANGDPLVMRSDFYYLADALNAKLDTLFGQIEAYDVDGDGRLRVHHPDESDGLAGQPNLVDYDGDEYVDDHDLFLAHFDGNGDDKVCYDPALAAAAGLGSLGNEFNDIDDQLARLIDQANPDRDGDGEITASDTGLGYNDGVLDANDQYAKVRGRLGFAIAREPWDAANGASYQTIVNGAIRSEIEVPPVSFEVTDEEMREITTDMFANSQTWFDTNANGDPFGYDPATDQIVPGGQATAAGFTAASASPWEAVPYDSFGAYDYYRRPRFQNMTFRDVCIPKGTNALFEGCTFIGVTFIETQQDCDDVNWNYAGAVEQRETPAGSGNFTYPLKFPTLTATIPSTGQNVADTRAFSNNIRFHDCTFLGSIAGDRPGQASWSYTHWRNKLQFTGSTRFYIDEEDADLLEQPDAATLVNHLQTLSATEIEELEKSSILMPGWSIDVGNFTNEQAVDPEDTAKVKLKGTIIAGILDVRGTAEVFGTLLMTFRPEEGMGPLHYGGLTDAFNTTIGYFGVLDGDGEGVDPTSGAFEGFGEIMLRYNPDAKLPDGIPWPIRIVADPTTYTE